jgi:uncharacterized membrane protein
MFRKRTVTEAAGSAVEYVDPLATDEKLRTRLIAALTAAQAARAQVQRQAGMAGMARRLASDPILRAHLRETVKQLAAAQKRARKIRSHRFRNAVLVVAGAGTAVAAIPRLRKAVSSPLEATAGWVGIEEEIEVDVPVTTAYNQWTQFEEFPQFMDGVDEVTQVDDTLLHWAVTVGGRHAEWNAKIIEQEPDQRIVWESTDGRKSRGTVTFDQAGPARSRIRLHMTYRSEDAAERVGSALGLDSKRVRGDLERFRDLIEARRSDASGWRGEIDGGVLHESPDS